MAITRRWQAAFDSNGTSSLWELSGWGSYVTIADWGGGSYGLQVRIGSTYYGSVTVPGTKQIRVGAMLYLPSVAGTNESILSFYHSGGLLCHLRTDAQGYLALEVGGTIRDTLPGFIPVTKWMHIGFNIKIDGVSGWVSVYVDGVKQLTYTGNTGTADIVEMRLNGCSSLYTYWNDSFLDDTTGESDAAVPHLLFGYRHANGAGNYSQMSIYPDSGEGHYEDIDDPTAHDSDGTYVYADALNERDTFAMEDVSLPPGLNIRAVIGWAYARKSNAGIATKMALACRENATDATGADQDLPVSYAQPIWERWTTAPDTDAWTETNWNAAEIGVVGKGVYS